MWINFYDDKVNENILNRTVPDTKIIYPDAKKEGGIRPLFNLHGTSAAPSVLFHNNLSRNRVAINIVRHDIHTGGNTD